MDLCVIKVFEVEVGQSKVRTDRAEHVWDNPRDIRYLYEFMESIASRYLFKGFLFLRFTTTLISL